MRDLVSSVANASALLERLLPLFAGKDVEISIPRRLLPLFCFKRQLTFVLKNRRPSPSRGSSEAVRRRLCSGYNGTAREAHVHIAVTCILAESHIHTAHIKLNSLHLRKGRTSCSHVAYHRR